MNRSGIRVTRELLYSGVQLGCVLPVGKAGRRGDKRCNHSRGKLVEYLCVDKVIHVYNIMCCILGSAVKHQKVRSSLLREGILVGNEA